MRILHKDSQLFGPTQNYQDSIAIVTDYNKGCNGFAGNFKTVAKFSSISTSVGHRDLVSLMTLDGFHIYLARSHGSS